jgi:hypothetical protein
VLAREPQRRDPWCEWGLPRSRSWGTERYRLQGSFSRAGSMWVYSLRVDRGSEGWARPRGRSAVLHLLADSFHPERWGALAEVLAHRYGGGGSSDELLRLFLEAQTTGKVGAAWSEGLWSNGSALTSGGKLASVTKLLGDGAVVIWAALLLRRRVMVLAPSPADLCVALRALPLFVAHRGKSEWDWLRPFVGSAASGSLGGSIMSDGGARTVEARERARGSARVAAAEACERAVTWEDQRAAGGAVELAELVEGGWSIAGTTCAALESRPDLWDLWVDLSGRRVQVSEASSALLEAPTAAHRQVAAAMGEALAAESGRDEALGRAVAAASRDVLDKLRSLGSAREDGQTTLSFAALEAAGVKGGTLAFLWEVARVEESIVTVDAKSDV